VGFQSLLQGQLKLHMQTLDRKSIEVDPTPVDAQGFKTRGLAKSALGDKQGAKADFLRAGSYGDHSIEEEIQNNNGSYPYDVVRQDVMRYMIRSL